MLRGVPKDAESILLDSGDDNRLDSLAQTHTLCIKKAPVHLACIYYVEIVCEGLCVDSVKQEEE